MFFRDPPLPLEVIGRAVSHRVTQTLSHCCEDPAAAMGRVRGETPASRNGAPSASPRAGDPGALPQKKAVPPERMGSVFK